MYPMLGTHPDLAYMVAALGRHSVTPGADHQHALECALWYLKAMSDQQLVFQCRTPSGTVLHGFVDADWASDVNDRKSTSGFVFMLGGTAVSWSSKKQTLVTLLSTEAEYIATLHATKEVVWLRRLLSKLGLNINSPTVLHVDNQSTIAIAHNLKFHDHTKHIEVQHHFLRHKVEGEEIHFEYTPTDEQTTDVLTKGLVHEKHKQFSKAMGLHCLGWGGVLEAQPPCGATQPDWAKVPQLRCSGTCSSAIYPTSIIFHLIIDSQHSLPLYIRAMSTCFTPQSFTPKTKVSTSYLAIRLHHTNILSSTHFTMLTGIYHNISLLLWRLSTCFTMLTFSWLLTRC